jgi:hypothetical protein
LLEGELLDTIIGMTDARTEMVLLRAPGWWRQYQLATPIRPEQQRGGPAAIGVTSAGEKSPVTSPRFASNDRRSDG